MKSGEFILFDSWLLHRSSRNLSTRQRLALTARMTVPSVKVGIHDLFPGYRTIIVLGSDGPGRPGGPGPMSDALTT